ncbi:Uncharacterised protein [Rikenella microfusus]|uniref:Uncharacterized protein n=1 Tax=Rikenella microfusus TaxID=28139 RepID=A0A379MQC9_9BACT|nr:Uncharacterised protein [Rikenella microfusus]
MTEVSGAEMSVAQLQAFAAESCGPTVGAEIYF